jgi:flagellar FliL protein
MAVEAEAEVEDGQEQVKKPRIPRRLLIIGAAGLIVLLLAGAALYFFVFAGRGAADAAKAQAAVSDTFIFNLPSMTVNLNDDGAPGDQFL